MDRAPHAANQGSLLGTFDWTKRTRRPPADPLNACLSLAYALLARVTATVLALNNGELGPGDFIRAAGGCARGRGALGVWESRVL